MPSQRRMPRGAGAPALDVSEEQALRSRLLRARHAALIEVGLLWPWKSAAPRRGLFSSASGRGATYKLWPPIPSQRRVSRGAGVPALAISEEEAKCSGLLRAHHAPLVAAGL